jgi:tetratricopeptide (TPR) repeat protein
MRRSVAYLLSGIVAVGGSMLVALLVTRREPERARVSEILNAHQEESQYAGLTIRYPLDQTLFPPESVSPTFCWEDGNGDSDAWMVSIEFQDGEGSSSSLSDETKWTPSDDEWQAIKRRSLEKDAKVTVAGVNSAAPERLLSAASISIRTSQDEVGAPIFYREVILPFIDAYAEPFRIRWRFGAICSKEQPPIVLQNLPVCGNCHSFSRDGRVLGLDVDYANDKGSYAISPVSQEISLSLDKIITWSDYRRDSKEPTFGLLSQLSPDGRYVVSTVKDRSVFVATEDLEFSQLFFPIKGILVVYDRRTKQFRALPGGDDRRFVQSNPTWSPDGKHIVFARREAHRLRSLSDADSVLLKPEDCREFLRGGKVFRYDLYRLPFNDGEGGEPEPLQGASNNGMSNYFAKYSPDGRWIVFCKAKSFMLLQPDSELYIIPAEGGEARRLRCNTRRMNSWHSWSPNGKWLVFSSKAYSVYTQLFLTHIDEEGRSSPPVVLSQFTSPNRAANIPEFVNIDPLAIKSIREQFVDDYSYARAGQAYRFKGDHEGAVRSYRQALEMNPNSAVYHNNLGLSLAEGGKLEEAKAEFINALEYDPDQKDVHNNLGSLLRRQGNFEEAIAHYREAVRIDPEHVEAQLSLGTALSEFGRLKEAAVHLSQAARLDPRNPFPLYHLGIVWHKQGRLDEAAALYGRALEQEPNFVPANLGLAAIRARAKDPELRDLDEAIQLATKACELTGHRDPLVLDILAEIYALAGRFRDAASTTRRALRITCSEGNEGLANTLQRKLAGYEQRGGSESP